MSRGCRLCGWVFLHGFQVEDGRGSNTFFKYTNKFILKNLNNVILRYFYFILPHCVMHYHVRECLYAVYKHWCSALRSRKRGQRQSSAGKSTSACIQHITTTSSVIMLLHNSSTITQYRSESLVYLVNSYTRKSSPLNVSKTNTLLGIVVGLHHNSQAPRGRMCTNMGYLIDIFMLVLSAYFSMLKL